MFCDADDRLFDCTALLNLFNAMRVNNVKTGEQFNLLSSSFYEEHIAADGKGYDLIKHEKPTMIWMHGKVFRRSFLEKYNIRFLPGLRTFEDTFFGKCVALLAPQETQIHCNYFTYLWVRNPDSVTSKWNHDNRDYLYWNNHDYIMCNRNLLIKLKKEQPMNTRLKELAWVDLFFTFFLLQLKEFNDTEEETKKRVYNMYQFMFEIINNYEEELKSTTMVVRLKYYMTLRNDMPKYGLTIEELTWNNFVKQLEEGVGKDLSWLLLHD